MNVTLGPATLVIGSVVLISAFAAVRIMTVKTDPRMPSLALGTLILVAAVSMSGVLVYDTGIFRVAPKLSRLSEPFRFLIGPLLYLYVVSLTRGRIRLGASWILHVAPFLANAAALTPYYLMAPSRKIEYIETAILPPSASFIKESLIGFVFMLAQVCVYLVLIRREAAEFERKIEDNYSDIDRINVRWINVFALGTMAYCAILAAIIALGLSGLVRHVDMRPIPFLASFFLFAFVYKALSQSRVSLDAEAVPGTDASSRKRRGERPPVPSETLDDIEARLDAYMKEGRPYLESELTLKELAEGSGLSTRLISQVINDRKRVNFYAFVNAYRVEEVKRMLADPSLAKESILMIAYDAGFNSKATFNAVFKQSTGLTPLRYRKRGLSAADFLDS
jgi:AraC-like DNA-binding protein